LEIHVYIDSKTILKHVSMSESEKFAELTIYSWGIKNQLDVTCYFYFTWCLLNTFRALICPSDIKLVFNSSTITMMHGTINIRLTIYNPAARTRTVAFVIKKLVILLIIYLCAPRESSIYSVWSSGWNTLHNTHIWFSFQRHKLVCTMTRNTMCGGYEK
jgi:hypothetical protein